MAKILIVEDDKIILNMYRLKFTHGGHTVELAENGQKALELMKTFRPDIVLMDLMMPVMDGYQALTKAKEDPEIKNIPIVILTNLSMAEDAEKTKKKGAIDYIVKSDLTPGEVLEKIKQYLPKV